MTRERVLFLCGDVMTGRGIDQVLPHSVDPELHEPVVKDARAYIRLAEKVSGALPERVGYEHIWGDALAELERVDPDHRIINLETAVTTSDRWMPKGINYRMHPGNVPCLTAAGLDCCVLANNHVLDWEEAGLMETCRVLQEAGLKTAGAGANAEEARSPAVLTSAGGARVLVFAFAARSSGVPPSWAAGVDAPGVAYLLEPSAETAEAVAAEIRQAREPGDVVVVSVHWGGNWGYAIPPGQRRFARCLIDRHAADVVHGHSSHHPKGIEVHRGRPILYGCGDFLNDYEGISGDEEYRGELVLMYFPHLDARTGRLTRLRMTPLRIRRFRLQRASDEETRWLQQTLDRESEPLGSRVELAPDGRLELTWTASEA
ncbi:MAG: CapA family protein [Myxococcota bacterium]